MTKAFHKINNPKDKSLIRVYVKERLTDVGVNKVQGKSINHCNNLILEYTYKRIFKTDPTIDYLENKRQNRKEGRVESIYFIGNREYQLVKIGFSTYPEDRMKQLQTGCPFELELFGVIKGSVKEEKTLHRKYSKYRINGEWFKIDGELKDYLELFLIK